VVGGNYGLGSKEFAPSRLVVEIFGWLNACCAGNFPSIGMRHLFKTVIMAMILFCLKFV
jgi:hypothetical protein